MGTLQQERLRIEDAIPQQRASLGSDIIKGIPADPRELECLVDKSRQRPIHLTLRLLPTRASGQHGTPIVVRPVTPQFTVPSAPQQNNFPTSSQQIPVPSAPERNTLQPHRTISVTVHRSVKERLRHFNLTSTLNLQADEDATFSQEQWDKVIRLSQLLNQNSTVLLRKLESQNVVAGLVKIGAPSSTVKSDYICIKGLQKEEDILVFHARVSKKPYRNEYKPLGLCYDRRLVSEAAADEEYSNNVFEGEFTLCGTLVQATRGGSLKWMSTIGGLIEIDGQMYALTTLHHAHEAKSDMRSASQDGESENASELLDTLTDDNDFDEEVQQALFVDSWKQSQTDVSFVSQLYQLPPRPAKAKPSSGIVLGKAVAQGSDWSLLSVDRALWRPNAISILHITGHRQSSAAGKVSNSTTPVCITRKYLISEDKGTRPTKKAVQVIAGVSGTLSGVLSPNPSFLKLSSADFSLVWTVRLPQGVELSYGDSGSWVVDVSNNSVLGHIVAFSDGVGYLQPIHQLFKDIKSVLGIESLVQLPSPFNLLADLARHFHSTSLRSGIIDSLASKYATEALSNAVLTTDNSIKAARVIRKALESQEMQESIERLLFFTGSDLSNALVDPDGWVSNAGDLRECRDEVLKSLRDLRNIANGLIPPKPHTPTPVPSLIEKEPKAGGELPVPVAERVEEKLHTKAENTEGGHELNQTQTGGSGIEYPTGLKLNLISMALCLSVFLTTLDNTIIATAIPKITDEFNSLADVGWYGSAYLLTRAAFQLLFGKFYSFFSVKWVYLSAMAIFELGSILCGVAPNSNALIVGRAIAGLGNAGVFSGAIVIVAYSVPLQNRHIYGGLIRAMYCIASVAGPLLGGAFTDMATWRWCFYINLPPGAITIMVIILFFKAPDRKAIAWKQRAKELDLFGTLFFVPAIACLLFALQWGGSKYTWNEGRIIALFVSFGVFIITFIGIQIWMQDNATVPPRIIKNRSVAASSFFAFCLGSGFSIMTYYIPVWFQAVLGVSAVQSGIRNLPLVLGSVLAPIISGIGVSLKSHYAPWMIASSIVMATGFGLITTFKPDTGSPSWIGLQCLAGIGVGLGIQQPFIAVQTVLNIKDVPTGISVLIFLQTLGGALFVSVGENVFMNKLVSGLAEYAPSINPLIVLSTGATSIQSTQSISPEDLAGVILAYNNALVKVFTVATCMAAISILGSVFVEWKSMKMWGKKVVTNNP